MKQKFANEAVVIKPPSLFRFCLVFKTLINVLLFNKTKFLNIKFNKN